VAALAEHLEARHPSAVTPDSLHAICSGGDRWLVAAGILVRACRMHDAGCEEERVSAFAAAAADAAADADYANDTDAVLCAGAQAANGLGRRGAPRRDLAHALGPDGADDGRAALAAADRLAPLGVVEAGRGALASTWGASGRSP